MADCVCLACTQLSLKKPFTYHMYGLSNFFLLHSVFMLLNRDYSFYFVPLFRLTAVRCPFFVAAIVTKTCTCSIVFHSSFFQNAMCFVLDESMSFVSSECFSIYTFANQCKVSCLGVLIYAWIKDTISYSIQSEIVQSSSSSSRC